MNKHALLHRAKSEYAYALDENTLSITFRSAKNDLKKVEIIYGDPFNWQNSNWNHQVDEMVKKYVTTLFDYFTVNIKSKDFRTKYTFILTDNNDNKYLFGSKRIALYNLDNKFDLQNYFNYPYINHEDLAKTPTWVKDTVWYQIFPDRFYTDKPLLKWGSLPVNNNQIFGGNLQGVIAKLPYLKDLGINGIYFTPIFEAKTAHKYDTIDYFKIDPSFGSNDDFKMLVKEAHKLDIKVMLDGVFNHSGFKHPFFQDVILNGEKSIYKNSFFIKDFPVVNFPVDENGNPLKHTTYDQNFRTFAYTPHMPKWNTDDEIAKAHLLEVIRYWIEEYNIDGWRLDVSNEISHDFLREIRKTALKANPNTFILGENWDQSLPWLLGDQLDSVMNYDLSYPIWEYLEHKIDLITFKDIINSYLALTPKNFMENMFNLLESHDTVRILRRLNDNKDRAKLAYLLMFLSAGAPNIYYGGEIGLTGDHDPDNRRTMIWDKSLQDLELYGFIKQLITLRNHYNSFKNPDYYFIESDLLVFIKKANNEELLVVINNSDYEKQFILTNNLKGRYLDLITGYDKVYDKIELASYEFKLLLKI
ncbi:MAG TPA: alpha-glycosidase [Acholeplasmataceae bacterium]|nr:alpha-glycosidase [Acholeplasmataceae bacterium]